MEHTNESELSTDQESMGPREGFNYPDLVPYKHLIEKEITDKTQIVLFDFIFGYICLGKHDSEIIGAFKTECVQSPILWGENIPENLKEAKTLNDLIDQSDVIMWYADNTQASKDLFYKHFIYSRKLSGKCIINFTNSDPEDSRQMHDAAIHLGADYLEARILRMPKMAKVNIYSSGGIRAFDAGAMLFKAISYRTYYCGTNKDSSKTVKSR